MARRLPPLNALRVFEAAAHLESFSAAADELCVTHGAVSRQIALLEEWLGHPLFERQGRRVTLNIRGRAYLAQISDALDRIALATSEQLEVAQRQTVRVNAPATFALRCLLPQLASFRQQHPSLEVLLSTSNEPLEQLRDDFDIAIRGHEQRSSGYVVSEFLSEVRLPVCSPRLLADHPLHDVTDLAHHTLLHSATHPGLWSQWLAAAGHPGLTPRHALPLDHFYLTLQAAIEGLGVAMGPTALVALDVEEGRLVQPFRRPSLPAWRYCSYVRDARIADPAIGKFLEWLGALGKRLEFAG